MAACPTCGGRVPLGGGKTVRNAHELLSAMRQIQARGLQPDYLNRGLREADWLHRYGHRDPSIAQLPRDEVMPHFGAAGLILREAASDLARLR